MAKIKIGIIGGSGFDDPDIFKDKKDETIKTKYGAANVSNGTMNDVDICFIARHGKKHEITPTVVNYQANIAALKEKNVNCIIGTTACGSLREEIKRGDFIILDQFIDFTKYRKNTFFEDFKEKIVHTPMSAPFDSTLNKIIYKKAKDLNIQIHKDKTLITIEGPRFSTKAESFMFRSWNADIINMSTATECILANEAQIPYSAIAMSTDYDCWKDDEEAVSWEAVLETFHENVDKMKKLLFTSITEICNSFKQ